MKSMIRTVILSLCISLAGSAYAQDYQWAIGMGGSASDEGRSIAIDASGNTYVTGYFSATADFDPGAGIANLTSEGGLDIFVAKYDAGGNYVWAISMGGPSNDVPYGIALDNSGNVYITGYFYGTADFDPGTGVANLTSAGDADIFIAKYDNAGNYLWANRFGASSVDIGYNIALDGSGNIYITGFYYGTVDFDPGPGTANLISAGGYDIFFAKYDGNGNYLWAHGIGSTGDDRAYSIAVDAGGNCHITGFFSGSADFDPGAGTAQLTAGGDYDIFFAKYDAGGNYLWAKKIGTTEWNEGRSIAIDHAGNCYVTGYFSGTADFDPGAGTANLTSAGWDDIFFAKYDANGNFIWANRAGSTGFDMGTGIAADGSGNTYVTGYFRGTVDFDPGAGTANLVSAGGDDIFFAKYDTAGNYCWAKRIGNTADDVGRCIILDSAGAVYITGSFRNTADFDPGAGVANLTAVDGNDVFLAKYACTNTGSSHTISECNSYLWHGTLLTSTDTYYLTIPNTAGCDSVMTLHLTINFADTSVIHSGNMLTANASGAAYQWLDCGNGFAEIIGATSQSYTPAVSGAYAVEVTEFGCTDTSACYSVSMTGLENSNARSRFQIYPNPFSLSATVEFNAPVQNAEIHIINVFGQEVSNKKGVSGRQVQIARDELSTGLYIIRVIQDNDVSTGTFVVAD